MGSNLFLRTAGGTQLFLQYQQPVAQNPNYSYQQPGGADPNYSYQQPDVQRPENPLLVPATASAQNPTYSYQQARTVVRTTTNYNQAPAYQGGYSYDPYWSGSAWGPSYASWGWGTAWPWWGWPGWSTAWWPGWWGGWGWGWGWGRGWGGARWGRGCWNCGFHGGFAHAGFHGGFGGGFHGGGFHGGGHRKDRATGRHHGSIEAAALEAHLGQILSDARIPELPNHYAGKVRDNYDLVDDRRIIIAILIGSARSIDSIITAIPLKGQALTQIARFWFDATRDICPNHVIEYPDPNVLVCRRLSIMPVEIVVRDYLTGTTATSIWPMYRAGLREIYGIRFPDGLRENEKLPSTIITPTTKAFYGGHDVPLTADQIIGRTLLTGAQWREVSELALSLFARGREIAGERGLILVDTKYEFGFDLAGHIVLADEIHTPDSSRYWLEGSYRERFAAGHSPETLDKDFVRRWVVARCDPYRDPIPEIPREIVAEAARLYVEVFETITGQRFDYPDPAKVPILALASALISLARTSHRPIRTAPDRRAPPSASRRSAAAFRLIARPACLPLCGWISQSAESSWHQGGNHAPNQTHRTDNQGPWQDRRLLQGGVRNARDPTQPARRGDFDRQLHQPRDPQLQDRKGRRCRCARPEFRRHPSFRI